MRDPIMMSLRREGYPVPAKDLPICVFVRPPVRMGIDYVRDGQVRLVSVTVSID